MKMRSENNCIAGKMTQEIMSGMTELRLWGRSSNVFLE